MQDEVRIETLSPIRHLQLRRNKSAAELPNGWLLFSDTNMLRNEILLVSLTKPMLVAFKFEKPYHTVIRARIRAEAYAEQHPQRSVGQQFAPTHRACAAPIQSLS